MGEESYLMAGSELDPSSSGFKKRSWRALILSARLVYPMPTGGGFYTAGYHLV